MPDISELINLGCGGPSGVVQRDPFAAAGGIQLWNVVQPSDFGRDQVVAVALVNLKMARGVMVESEDIPALYDLLRGIVERNKLT